MISLDGRQTLMFIGFKESKAADEHWRPGVLRQLPGPQEKAARATAFSQGLPADLSEGLIQDLMLKEDLVYNLFS